MIPPATGPTGVLFMGIGFSWLAMAEDSKIITQLVKVLAFFITCIYYSERIQKYVHQRKYTYKRVERQTMYCIHFYSKKINLKKLLGLWDTSYFISVRWDCLLHPTKTSPLVSTVGMLHTGQSVLLSLTPSTPNGTDAVPVHQTYMYTQLTKCLHNYFVNSTNAINIFNSFLQFGSKHAAFWLMTLSDIIKWWEI